MPIHARHDGAITLLENNAFLLFAQKGFAGVSVGELAKASGLSRGAMYWHFASKEDLFLACLKRLHGLFEFYVFGPMQRESLGQRRLMLMIQGLKLFLRDPMIEKGVAGYWLVEDPRFLQTQREFESAYTELLRETLELAETQNALSFDQDLNVMARAIMALVEAMVLPLRYQSADEAGAILDVLIGTLLRAYAQSATQSTATA